MKKILLTLAIALTANFTFAQRNIDWSVEQVISPTSIVHGQPINVHIVCKNNGTADANIGDSVFTRIFLNNGQLASNWFFQVLTKDLLPDDTMHVKLSFAAVNITGLSFSSTFIAQSVIQNRPGMSLEQSGTLTNNAKSVTIDYINEKGWGVSVNNVNSNDFMSLYPNPATDVLNIDVKMLGSADAEIELIDLNGKVVYSAAGYNTASGFSINVADLNKGLYMVRIKNGDFISTAKINIQ